MAPPRVAPVFLVALAILLAGCSHGTPSDDDPPGTLPPPPPAREPGADEAREAGAGNLPFWFAGLTFRYDVTHAGLEGTREMGVTVLAGHDDPYFLFPSGDADAIRWSLYWGLPPIGPVSGGDLDPIHDGAPLGWFSFPLRDEKAWTGQDFDGTPLAFTATLTRATLPNDRDAPAYAVVGMHEGTPRMGYTYTAEAGWFLHAWRDIDGDGKVDAQADLVRIAIAPDIAEEAPLKPVRVLDLRATGPESALPPAVPPVLDPVARVEFSVPADAEEMIVVHRFLGGPGLYRTHLTFADDTQAAAEWLNDEEDARFLRMQARGAVAGAADALVVLVATDAVAHVVVVALVPG